MLCFEASYLPPGDAPCLGVVERVLLNMSDVHLNVIDSRYPYPRHSAEDSNSAICLDLLSSPTSGVSYKYNIRIYCSTSNVDCVSAESCGVSARG